MNRDRGGSIICLVLRRTERERDTAMNNNNRWNKLRAVAARRAKANSPWSEPPAPPAPPVLTGPYMEAYQHKGQRAANTRRWDELRAVADRRAKANSPWHAA